MPWGELGLRCPLCVSTMNSTAPLGSLHADTAEIRSVVCLKVLLWQANVITDPHVFVIATCIRSELIIYLLVCRNKQLPPRISWAWDLGCLDTSRSRRRTHSDIIRATERERKRRERVGTIRKPYSEDSWRTFVITTYREANDQIRSNTGCDDENEQTSGDTCLPEQHISILKMNEKLGTAHRHTSFQSFIAL